MDFMDPMLWKVQFVHLRGKLKKIDIPKHGPDRADRRSVVVGNELTCLQCTRVLVCCVETGSCHVSGQSGRIYL